LKKAAEKGEFDVLLVFMFDRIGRMEDETPFIVEWFVKNGIEVWSVVEGEQRFDTHTDKLMNFIRFWQANGESEKTSIRVKESMNQMTEKGIYTGGVTPFGYMTVPSKRVNKRGKELLDLVIDPTEAPIVSLIFEKSVREGYGSYRLASLLNEMGIKTHNGSKFQCNTINRILKNRMYCGYYTSGDIISPHLPKLQIIDEGTYDLAQKIIEQRNRKNEKKTQIAFNTKGSTLLSGNIYCTHCGSHMTATSCVDKYTRKDGSQYYMRRQRYICSRKGRNTKHCEGQSAYMASKIDKVVSSFVSNYLFMTKTMPKTVSLEKRYQAEIADLKILQREVTQENKTLQGNLEKLTVEISRSLSGESKFTPDTLSMAIENIKTELRNTEDKLAQLNYEINNSQGAMKKLDHDYDQFVRWSIEYEDATLEEQKMIVCQLVREVKVSRGYELDIVMDMTYRQFFTMRM